MRTTGRIQNTNTRRVKRNNSFLARTLGSKYHLSKKGLFQKVVGDIPETNVNVTLDPVTMEGIKAFGIILGSGFALDGFFRYLATRNK
jgi:hypothetical protein